MSLPDKNENYKDVDYWNERYVTEESYEWCKDYSSFKLFFNAAVPNKNSKILIIGCGNSNLSADLYRDGYGFIVNIDYSEIVIEKMKKKHGHVMEFHVMDMRTLTFQEKFDVVLEKGTLDVLFTTEKSVWSLSPETQKDLHCTLASISSVLSPSGRFISVTFAEPYFRKQQYLKYWSTVTVQNFGDFFHYYFYNCSNRI